MKKMTIMASAIMMAAAAYATPNTTSVETKPFEEVLVNVPANVRFIYGEDYSVNIRSTNNEDKKALRMSVENGVLKINTRDGEDIENLRITIVSPNLPELKTGRNMEAVNTKNIK